MSEEQQYRPLKAGEILCNGDEYLNVRGDWIGYPAHRFGKPISELATGRRPVPGETETETETMETVEYRSLEVGEIIQDGDQFFYDGEWVAYQPHRFGSPLDSAAEARRPVVQSETAADRTPPTLAARLQNSLDDAICCNMNLQVQRDKLQAELEASQRAYMAAMAALEREVVQHRETNRTLDEVCRERDALQEQLQERAGEPRKSEILDFLGVQIAVIPYLQAAVGKDAQRELTIAGRTLQMVHNAIESDRIGREGEDKSTGDGKEGA